MDSIVFWIVGSVLLLLAYAAVLVTYHTIRSDCFSAKQKAAIIAIAWLIPLFGPAMIIRILAEEKPLAKKPGVPLLQFIFLAGVIDGGRTSTESDSTQLPEYIAGDTGGSDT